MILFLDFEVTKFDWLVVITDIFKYNRCVKDCPFADIEKRNQNE